MKQPELCYAESRYLMLYLHHCGKLADWYANYLGTFEKSPSGKAALEKTFKKKLDRIERKWLEWVKGLRLPFGEMKSFQARLGMQLKDTPSGVKVAGFLPGSAAQRSGQIKKGDTIRKFNGKTVKKAIEVIAEIHRLSAMQTITIELYRNNRSITIHQPLSEPSFRMEK